MVLTQIDTAKPEEVAVINDWPGVRNQPSQFIMSNHPKSGLHPRPSILGLVVCGSHNYADGTIRVRDQGSARRYQARSPILAREKCTSGDTKSSLVKKSLPGLNSSFSQPYIMLLTPQLSPEPRV